MAQSFTATFLVGSSLAVVGIRFQGYNFSSKETARAALDVEYRIQGATTWNKLSDYTNPVVDRGVHHIYHNDWKFERNMWRACISDLMPGMTYEARAKVLTEYSSIATFTTDDDKGPMDLRFIGYEDHSDLQKSIEDYWSYLYTNNIRKCGMWVPGSMPVEYTSGSTGSYVFSRLVIGDYINGTTPTISTLDAEVADESASTTVGRKCLGAFTFLHEMRHLFGISPWTSTSPYIRQGWQGRGDWNEIDTDHSFIEVGITTAGVTFPASFPNTVGAYFEDQSSGSYSTTKYYAIPPSGQTGSPCQLAQLYQFMRCSDLVHPRITGDHSNLPDGNWYEDGKRDTTMADIEMVFLLRALMFDKFTIVSGSYSE